MITVVTFTTVPQMRHAQERCVTFVIDLLYAVMGQRPVEPKVDEEF